MSDGNNSAVAGMVTLQERMVNLINQLNMPLIEVSLVLSKHIAGLSRSLDEHITATQQEFPETVTHPWPIYTADEDESGFQFDLEKVFKREKVIQEKNNLIQEVNNSAATSGTFSNAALNSAGEEALISQLSANSSDPYRYAKPGFSTKDWQFVLEENAANTLSLPQRRIKATNINFSSQFNPFIGYVVYNSRYAKTYSYTTSVKTLVSETKQVIDSLNSQVIEIIQNIPPKIEKILNYKYDGINFGFIV